MLKRRGRWRTFFGLKGELYYYDSSSESSRIELTPFERKSLKFASRSFWATVLSVVVACGAAYFILQQFKEMAEQTNLLGISLRRARNDSKDAAVSTEKQLALTQKSVDAFQKQATAAEDESKAALVAAQTAQNQLELSERPWLDFQGSFAQPYWEVFRGAKIMGKPETVWFLNIHIPMTFTVSNVGRSPATRTFVSVDIVSTDNVGLPTPTFQLPLYPMGTACAVAESERQSAEKSTSDRHGDVIFPGAAPINGRTEPIQGGPEYLYRPLKGLWVAACVVYQSGFSPRIYHTKIWYLSLPRRGVKEPIPIAPDLEYTWQPFDSFVLYGSEAD